MYTKSIQIFNYGPISQLDIRLPFNGVIPKPVVLVGENGSGKSIFLSHIVNGLVGAKGQVYPETPEVETGKVFKVRSPSYIRPGAEWCYAKVTFEQSLYTGEIISSRPKKDFENRPLEFPIQEVSDEWDNMQPHENNRIISNIHNRNDTTIRNIFSQNCVIYFPHSRFEEPAWLNEENLKAQAKNMDIKRLERYTNRRVINNSSLHDNQDWLFDVAYDRAVFENQIENLFIRDDNTNQIRLTSEWKGYRGNSTNVYTVALDLVRRIMRHDHDITLGIGGRLNRTVFLKKGSEVLVPNIFQLSSGETSLLNLFLSILRDFDLSEASFTNANEIRGIVVVDEIDLHLHAVHQREVLPNLIQMFPKVQFIVTTHSPLFVLGMSNAFGEDGFALYRLPDGQQISPEDFSEFGSAYQMYRSSTAFSDDVRRAVKNAQRAILYMEGKTDILYLQTAARLLGRETVMDRVDLQDGGGGRLKKVWDAVSTLSEEVLPSKVMVLYDCEFPGQAQTKGNRLKRKLPRLAEHPIEKGIENLFSKATLEKAENYKAEFIDIAYVSKRSRGKQGQTSEIWTINDDEKMNLCNWLCENGTADDFQHFQVIFDLLDELLDEEQAA